MKPAKRSISLDQFVDPLADCLTPESARRLLAMQVDPQLQARFDDLAQLWVKGWQGEGEKG